jgi:hypothetical protein
MKHPIVRSCFCLVAFAAEVWGQTAQLSGVVRDASGAIVPFANLTAINQKTGVRRISQSNGEGYYSLPSLQPGDYSVQAQAAGFEAAIREDLNLAVDQNARLNFTIEITRNRDEVNVQDAPSAVVNTSDAALGLALSNRQVQQLPIEGRNVLQLLSLQPGAVYLGENLNADTDSRSGSVNGARSDQSHVTLDGVDVNDQNKGYAFLSVLRNTQDSVQEFRVITSNADAEAGSSSGAQVVLITRGGANTFHGSAYEYNRNTLFTANDYFLKASQLATGKSNRPAPLIRNVFGTSLGGPAKKDRLFFFLNYEGRRDDQAQSSVNVVPTQSFRQGYIRYFHSGGIAQTLSPGQIRSMDPLGIGANAAILALMRSYPLPNDPSLGDGLNTAGYRFAVNEKSKYDTYIGRIDYSLTPDGRHTIYWRGNLQGDKTPSPPQFPGQQPSTVALDNSRGFATGYTAVLSSDKVNVVRWGFTRQGAADTGGSLQPEVLLAAIDQPSAFDRPSSYRVPVHNLVDDFSWNRGSHSLQFGANTRLIKNERSNYSHSFPAAYMTDGWLENSGIAGKDVPFDPAEAGYDPVANQYRKSYDKALLTLVGIITEENAIYNYSRGGQPLPFGSPVMRDYRWKEQEYYGQDSWKLLRSLTLTFGLRYTLLEPPFEIHGNQVGPCTLQGSACAPLSLTNWFNESAQQGLAGGAAMNVPLISFAPNGKANAQPGLWHWDYKDLGPRAALAWAPNFKGGWLARLFGSEGQSSLRGGYSIVYDHFGAGMVNTYDAYGSFGLTSQVANVPGTVSVSTAPRFTGINAIPATLLPSAPPGGFPAMPSNDGFAISWGMDSAMKTPYAHAVNLSFSRELTKDSVLQIAYVGHFGRRLPEQEDVAMPLDLVDPKSGVDYFKAMTMLSKLAYSGARIGSVAAIPYFQDLFGPLNGTNLGSGPLTATQVVYSQVLKNLGNETSALFNLDLPNSQTNAGLNVPGHSYPSYRFYHDQYSSLYAWRTIGSSSYNGLQVSLHRRFREGLQADFNYTWSKSIDTTSEADRISASGSDNYAQIINSWRPNQLRGVSDFDATHQINSNWLFEFPVGRGRAFASHASPWLDAFIGGWQLSGLLRWTTGFPFSVNEGSSWPTNWNINGFAALAGPLPAGAANRGQGPQAFADPQAVFNAFRPDYPGESGTRNPLRGDGYFGLDAGLSKVLTITEKLKMRLRWDAFNVTNSVRFDVRSIGDRLDSPTQFGIYSSTLTTARVMQVAVRLEF